jgi:cellulose synthase/poly-beta-1,6-N-acetylglucosamine synthase-like glycosyltransferase
VPEPICWSTVPETIGQLRRQRIRWQVGLAESLAMNRRLLFHREGSFAGWVAFPFTVFFEWFGPLVETCGYIFVIAGFALGLISLSVFLTFLLLATGFGILLSTCALLLEEISFRLYKRPRHILVLLAFAVLDNFGYRQLNTLWRMAAVLQHLRRGVRTRLAGRKRECPA